MVHVSSTMWRIKNQPSNSTSWSESITPFTCWFLWRAYSHEDFFKWLNLGWCFQRLFWERYTLKGQIAGHRRLGTWTGTWDLDPCEAAPELSPRLTSPPPRVKKGSWKKRPLRLARRRPLPWPTPSPETSPADCRSFATQHTHQPTTGLTLEKFIGEYFTTLITPYVRSCAHHTTGCSREIACWTPGLCWGIDVCPRLFILLQSEEMPTDGAQKWPAWSAPDETDTHNLLAVCRWTRSMWLAMTRRRRIKLGTAVLV